MPTGTDGAGLRRCPAIGLVALVLILAGSAMRLYGIERKTYWHDEVYTSLHVAGFDGIDDLVAGERVFPVRALQERQQVSAARGVAHTISSVAAVDPANPPLYFVLLRFWAGVVGDSPATLRAFSAMLSIVSIALLMWLAWVLFESWRVAMVGAVLMAASPVFIAQAQEARPYAWWVAVALGASASLVRATRSTGWTGWAVYGGAVSLGLYSSLLFVPVMAAHALFVGGVTGGRRSTEAAIRPGTWFRFPVAATLGTLVFVPWMIVLMTGGQLGLGWTSVPMEPLPYLRRLATALGTLVVDLGGDFPDIPLLRWVSRIGVGALLVFFGWVVTRTARGAPLRPASFVTLLAILPLALPVLLDVMLGGRRATIPRFLLVTHVGVLLATAYVAAEWGGRGRRTWHRWTSFLVVGLLLFLQLASYHAWTTSTGWWTKIRAGTPPEVAQGMLVAAEMVNRSKAPLLIVDAEHARTGDLLMLSHVLDPEVRLMVAAEAAPPASHDGDIWLLMPTHPLRQRYEAKGYRLGRVLEHGVLWRVSPP